MPTYSQLVEFRIDPRQQPGLIAALVAVDEQFTCTCPGFIEASVQASDDGQRVLHQVLWQSREQGEAALANIESSVQDVQSLIRQYRVQAATFGRYQVYSQVQAHR